MASASQLGRSLAFCQQNAPCTLVLLTDSLCFTLPDGYAFSQVEAAVITQEELVRSYNTSKSKTKKLLSMHSSDSS